MSTLHPTLSEASGHGHEHAHGHELSFIKKYVFSTDHKVIGIQFLITTLLMLMVGGALALGVRWQLAFPWESMPIVGKLIFVTSSRGRSVPSSTRCCSPCMQR